MEELPAIFDKMSDGDSVSRIQHLKSKYIDYKHIREIFTIEDAIELNEFYSEERKEWY